MSVLSVMVVDDEISTVRGLTGVLERYPEDFETSGAFTSPLSALEYLERDCDRVDIVIADVRMPAMDGIALAGKISEHYPNIKTIMLSGHSDYESVRQCLMVGAVDYLLKPCRYQNLLALLHKFKQQKEQKEQSFRREQMKIKLREALLQGKEPTDDILPFGRTHIAFIRQARECREQSLDSALQDYVTSYPLSDGDNESSCLIFFISGGTFLLFDAQVGFNHFSRWLARLSSHFQNRGESLSVAYCGDNTEGFSQAVKDCRELAALLEFNESGRTVDIRQQDHIKNRLGEFPLLKRFSTCKLPELLQKGSKGELIPWYDKMCKSIREKTDYLDPVDAKKQAMQLLFDTEMHLGQLFGAISPREGQPGRFNHNDYMDRIVRVRTLGALLEVIREYLGAALIYCDASQSYPYYINKAVAYIRANYMKEIHLGDIASEVFLNEWYFSSQFKKHVGISFREFLNTVRIQAAKDLLCHSDLRVAQIAEMVGFADAAYFATTFKFFEGKTPKEYQRLMAGMDAKQV